MIRKIPYTTDSKAVELGLRARGAVAKHCNRCDTYAVLVHNMYCQECVDEFNTMSEDPND